MRGGWVVRPVPWRGVGRAAEATGGGEGVVNGPVGDGRVVEVVQQIRGWAFLYQRNPRAP